MDAFVLSINQCDSWAAAPHQHPPRTPTPAPEALARSNSSCFRSLRYTMTVPSAPPATVYAIRRCRGQGVGSKADGGSGRRVTGKQAPRAGRRMGAGAGRAMGVAWAQRWSPCNEWAGCAEQCHLPGLAAPPLCLPRCTLSQTGLRIDPSIRQVRTGQGQCERWLWHGWPPFLNGQRLVKRSIAAVARLSRFRMP